MKILQLGANGGIGVLLLEKALENGDEVFAYVRRENAIELKHKNLTVVVGNLDNEALLEPLIAKTDIVISTLGPAMDMSRKVKSTPLADAHSMIVRLMNKLDKKRFITIGTTTIKAKDDVKHYSNTLLPLIPKLLFPTGYQEYRKIGEIMNKSSIDWTVVRFLDPKAKNDNNGQYTVTLEGKSSKLMISRRNIAHFIHKVAKENLYVHQMPLIFH